MLRYLFMMGAVLGLALSACTKKSDKPTIWIYTGFYQFVVQDLNSRLEKNFPEVNFKWYQSGSENVAAKIEAELLAGKTQADIIIAGDMFWYEDLKSRGALLRYDSPATAKIKPPYRDPENHWAANRFATMVIAYNSDVYSEANAPKGFADLAMPRFKDKVSMGSPLESGTNFTTVALLSKKFGWEYYEKLRANGVIAAGGSSAVISRMETKERPVGVVLLENVIEARKKNTKIVAVMPKEGPVVMPGALAISATTPHPELAKRIFDFFFSAESAEACRHGKFHSILPDAPPPEGAPPLSEILPRSIPWSIEFIRGLKHERNEIKQRFSKIMYE